MRNILMLAGADVSGPSHERVIDPSSAEDPNLLFRIYVSPANVDFASYIKTKNSQAVFDPGGYYKERGYFKDLDPNVTDYHGAWSLQYSNPNISTLLISQVFQRSVTRYYPDGAGGSPYGDEDKILATWTYYGVNYTIKETKIKFVDTGFEFDLESNNVVINLLADTSVPKFSKDVFGNGTIIEVYADIQPDLGDPDVDATPKTNVAGQGLSTLGGVAIQPDGTIGGYQTYPLTNGMSIKQVAIFSPFIDYAAGDPLPTNDNAFIVTTDGKVYPAKENYVGSGTIGPALETGVAAIVPTDAQGATFLYLKTDGSLAYHKVNSYDFANDPIPVDLTGANANVIAFAARKVNLDQNGAASTPTSGTDYVAVTQTRDTYRWGTAQREWSFLNIPNLVSVLYFDEKLVGLTTTGKVLDLMGANPVMIGSGVVEIGVIESGPLSRGVFGRKPDGTVMGFKDRNMDRYAVPGVADCRYLGDYAVDSNGRWIAIVDDPANTGHAHFDGEYVVQQAVPSYVTGVTYKPWNPYADPSSIKVPGPARRYYQTWAAINNVVASPPVYTTGFVDTNGHARYFDWLKPLGKTYRDIDAHLYMADQRAADVCAVGGTDPRYLIALDANGAAWQHGTRVTDKLLQTIVPLFSAGQLTSVNSNNRHWGLTLDGYVVNLGAVDANKNYIYPRDEDAPNSFIANTKWKELIVEYDTLFLRDKDGNTAIWVLQPGNAQPTTTKYTTYGQLGTSNWGEFEREASSLSPNDIWNYGNSRRFFDIHPANGLVDLTQGETHTSDPHADNPTRLLLNIDVQDVRAYHFGYFAMAVQLKSNPYKFKVRGLGTGGTYNAGYGIWTGQLYTLDTYSWTITLPKIAINFTVSDLPLGDNTTRNENNVPYNYAFIIDYVASDGSINRFVIEHVGPSGSDPGRSLSLNPSINPNHHIEVYPPGTVRVDLQTIGGDGSGWGNAWGQSFGG